MAAASGGGCYLCVFAQEHVAFRTEIRFAPYLDSIANLFYFLALVLGADYASIRCICTVHVK